MILAKVGTTREPSLLPRDRGNKAGGLALCF